MTPSDPRVPVYPTVRKAREQISLTGTALIVQNKHFSSFSRCYLVHEECIQWTDEPRIASVCAMERSTWIWKAHGLTGCTVYASERLDGIAIAS